MILLSSLTMAKPSPAASPSPTLSKPPKVVAPIPLERHVPMTATKEEVILLELVTTPGNADSKKYKVGVRIYRSGPVEQFLVWRKALDEVFKGLEVTDAAWMVGMARRLLEGDALANFNNFVVLRGDNSVNKFKLVLKDLTAYVMPRKALRLQKRFMRRFLRKPLHMKIREFVARVQELNQYLTYFPPGGDNQRLSQDDLLELLESSIPNTWQREFTRTGYDPVDGTIADFVDHCERVEVTEDVSGHNKPSNKSKSSNKEAKGSKTSPHRSGVTTKGSVRNAKSSEEAYCPLHGPNGGHTLGQCHVMRAQAERMRTMHQAKSYDQKSSEHKDKKHKFRNEINAYVQQHFQSLLKKAKTDKSEEVKAFTCDLVDSDSDESSK